MGIENGYLKEYSDSGTIIIKGEYVYGEKEGLWFYEMGNHRKEGSYINSLRDGIWKHYYTNGKINYEGEFIDGNPHGKHKYYYKNGK